MSALQQTCALEAVGDGVFERDLDRTWWGWNGQFGGYVLALALEACRGAVEDQSHRELSLSMNFLRRVQEGRFRAEVTVERSGRTITNLSFRMSVEGKLVASGIAMFGQARDSQEFQVAEIPDLEIPTSAPNRSPIPAPTMDRLDVWPVHGGGELLTGAEVTEGGGWMRLHDKGGADERFGFIAADGCVPVAYARFDKPQIGGSLDFTAYFREPFPVSITTEGEPIRIVLRSARAREGYVDEDAELWSADGRLLMQTRQTRYSEIVDVDALDAMGDMRLMPPSTG